MIICILVHGFFLTKWTVQSAGVSAVIAASITGLRLSEIRLGLQGYVACCHCGRDCLGHVVAASRWPAASE